MAFFKLVEVVEVDCRAHESILQTLEVNLERAEKVMVDRVRIYFLAVNDCEAQRDARYAHAKQLREHCLVSESGPARQDDTLQFVFEDAPLLEVEPMILVQ